MGKMKIIEKIKEATIIQILSAMLGVLLLLIGSIYLEALPLILPSIVQQLPKTLLLKLLILAIVLFVLSVALSLTIYLKYLKLKTKLIPKFGVLWDKNKEAYCPACEISLSEYQEQDNPPIYEFTCVKCNAHIRLMHIGKSISLEDAQKILK